MYAFAYWHTYYDSAFLYNPFKISEALYHDLEITPTYLSRWPTLQKLPELPKLFQILEHFILEDYNWNECLCSEAEIDHIEVEINKIILCLQCQKRYAEQFWPKSKRRIQASIVHFSIILKKFTIAIIPEDCRNLLQAHRKQKLTTQMSKLEYLMNQILKIIKPIHHFLFKKDFEEQVQLTKEFFQDFNESIHQLPKIKRKHLDNIPRLMQYICVVNPIEAEQYQSKNNPNNRRKNATTFQKPKYKKKYSIDKNYDQINNNFQVINNSIVKKPKNCSLQKTVFDSPKRHSSFIQKFRVFKFNDRIRKYSIYHKPKKQTITSIDTKQKNSSMEKDRSPTHDRSLTVMTDRKKLKSMTLANDNRLRQQCLMQNRISKQLTSKSIFSRKSRSIQRVQAIQGDQIQHERQEKTQKKKAKPLPIKTVLYSHQQNLSNGKAKGWAIIRQYVQRKITQRKLKRLILN